MDVKKRQLSFIVVGMALFAMFFGAGNLIFPLYLGQVAKEQWVSAAAGFFLTAVALPLSAVFAMVIYKGNYSNFFSVLGKTPGLLVSLMLLTVWIPFGSGPRCATLAYASLLPYMENPPSVWLFNFAYCGGIFWLVFKKNRLLDVLGYVLTPILLGCLALIIFLGVSSAELTPNWDIQTGVLFRGLREGYNTMDLIAAFFFSASVIDILRRSSNDESASLKTTLKASFVGAALLAVVYFGLICLSVSHLDSLQGVPKDQLLVQIAKKVLGPQLGIIASISVFLACFTTSVALSSVFTDFLTDKIFKNSQKYVVALVVTQIITFCMSITGLEGITFVTEPILQILYPLLLILIIFNLGRHALFGTSQEVEAQAEAQIVLEE